MSPVERQILFNQYFIMDALSRIVRKDSETKLNLECYMRSTLSLIKSDTNTNVNNFKQEE